MIRNRIPTTALAFLAGCAEVNPPATPMAGVQYELDGEPSPAAIACKPDNDGILLPEGFCAFLVATDIPGARHLVIAGNGDIFVSRLNRRGENPVRGGISVLRDTDGDFRPDSTENWGVNGGNDVLLAPGYVYHAPNDAVLRYPIEPGSMVPSGPPDTIVYGLPDSLNHSAKSIALGRDGALYVAIGAHGNACMVESRTPGSPGMDPCPILEKRGGIWKFDAHRLRQSQEDGVRFATGIRNIMALSIHPVTDALYAVMHGRDQLHDLWPELYSVDESAENPAEEFIRITEGANFGWPYCYHDTRTNRKLLGPEYGGDGKEIGRCAAMDTAIIGFPAHWAPNDLEFYTGRQFPTWFHGGAFIAFHGSWNRAPKPQDGFKVVFVRARGDEPGTEWAVFADGFRKEGLIAGRGSARPVGVAMGPDGSLYIADSVQGRIWRVVYKGPGSPIAHRASAQ